MPSTCAHTKAPFVSILATPTASSIVISDSWVTLKAIELVLEALGVVEYQHSMSAFIDMPFCALWYRVSRLLSSRTVCLVYAGADRGGGSWGSGPPLFCQLRKKLKIVLNHHYYYDIIYVNK